MPFRDVYFFPQTCCLTEKEYSRDVRLLLNAEGVDFGTACKTRVYQSGNAAEFEFHVFPCSFYLPWLNIYNMRHLYFNLPVLSFI